MKIEDIRNKSEIEIVNEIMSLRKELMNLRFQKASAQLQNTSLVKITKKTISRLKTVLTEKNNNIVHKKSKELK